MTNKKVTLTQGQCTLLCMICSIPIYMGVGWRGKSRFNSPVGLLQVGDATAETGMKGDRDTGKWGRDRCQFCR